MLFLLCLRRAAAKYQQARGKASVSLSIFECGLAIGKKKYSVVSCQFSVWGDKLSAVSSRLSTGGISNSKFMISDKEKAVGVVP